MTVLKAHFDGRVLVPDEPVDLPTNCALEVRVVPLKSPESSPDDKKALERLARLAKEVAKPDPGRADGAAEHDHYLYGSAKRG
jgi:hypothetical protein